MTDDQTQDVDAAVAAEADDTGATVVGAIGDDTGTQAAGAVVTDYDYAAIVAAFADEDAAYTAYGNLQEAESSLFIDMIGRPLSPVSFAGARRRGRRRARRRMG